MQIFIIFIYLYVLTHQHIICEESVKRSCLLISVCKERQGEKHIWELARADLHRRMSVPNHRLSPRNCSWHALRNLKF